MMRVTFYCDTKEDEENKDFDIYYQGKLKLEKFIAWYFGCTEEEAADYIPDMQEDDFPEEE